MTYPPEVMLSQYPAPAFDEPACKNHHDRAAVEPVAYRRCAECQKAAQSGYADVMVKRDKERFYTSNEFDTDTSGAPLRGPGSREAKHRAHTVAQKEPDE